MIPTSSPLDKELSTQAVCDGDPVGELVDIPVSVFNISVGEPLGERVGAPVGAPVGSFVGLDVLEIEGLSVGIPVGAPVGRRVLGFERLVGRRVGLGVGFERRVGRGVGRRVFGFVVGRGRLVGRRVGLSVVPGGVMVAIVVGLLVLLPTQFCLFPSTHAEMFVIQSQSH